MCCRGYVPRFQRGRRAAVETTSMTMKTIITIAAIISSAGFGATQSPPAANSNPFNSSSAIAGSLARLAPALAQSPEIPPAPWASADPADSLYRLAREALSRGDYKRAAEIFHRIPERYPQSAYAGQALYYEAYALYRSGESDDLSAAIDRLNQLGRRYPNAMQGDAKSLKTRVCGELAKRGDESCTADISNKAEGDRDVTGGETRNLGSKACPSDDDENDDRIAALNALLQMDAERAMPILQKVLARRDGCSAALRRKAVFLVSQKRTTETANILMNVARSDPDQQVREDAVFWLSQVPGSTGLLEGILRGSGDAAIKDKAIFALSQQHEPRAQQILRDFALRDGENEDLREKAIFWLGQRRSTENTEFLRSLYSRLTNADLKDKVMFSLSQQRGAGNEQWLMDIALNPREDTDLRKRALFLAGQSGVAIPGLVTLYDRMTDLELKDQLIFVFSQRQRDPAAVDKLLDIAKNERNPELRKKAIFWLGQSRDPRVQQFLLDLINR